MRPADSALPTISPIVNAVTNEELSGVTANELNQMLYDEARFEGLKMAAHEAGRRAGEMAPLPDYAFDSRDNLIFGGLGAAVVLLPDVMGIAAKIGAPIAGTLAAKKFGE